MAEQWQLRHDTATENDAFLGAEGEVTVDMTNKTLRVHDGTTIGGTTLAKQETLDNIDYVIQWQNPTAENNYTWYRKYRSGWVEQGGTAVLPQQAASILATALATLPITMANGNYTVSWAQLSDAGNSHELTQVSVNRNTTNVGITFYSLADTNGGNVISWEIKGIAA